jgi:hypothetical protein
MAKSKLEILDMAQKFYVAKGYGLLPSPLTPKSLAADKKFCEFCNKYETAFQYYSKGGLHEDRIDSQLGGIDFNHPVERVVIPKGQTHTQIQAAWGAKGNYYGTSEETAPMLGISDQAKMFQQQFRPSYQKSEHDSKIEGLRSKMLDTVRASGRNYNEIFPELPGSPETKQKAYFDTNNGILSQSPGKCLPLSSD